MRPEDLDAVERKTPAEKRKLAAEIVKEALETESPEAIRKALIVLGKDSDQVGSDGATRDLWHEMTFSGGDHAS